jgi:hypothetical protein
MNLEGHESQMLSEASRRQRNELDMLGAGGEMLEESPNMPELSERIRKLLNLPIQPQRATAATAAVDPKLAAIFNQLLQTR